MIATMLQASADLSVDISLSRRVLSAWWTRKLWGFHSGEAIVPRRHNMKVCRAAVMAFHSGTWNYTSTKRETGLSLHSVWHKERTDVHNYTHTFPPLSFCCCPLQGRAAFSETLHYVRQTHTHTHAHNSSQCLAPPLLHRLTITFSIWKQLSKEM